jgi:UDP-glucose 4-epimerase
MPASCLVTGGAGFIGSALVRALLARGDRVRVIDNFFSGKRENLADVAKEIELVEGDLRDEAALGRALAGVELVFHEAAIPSVPRSLADPLASHEANATGTLNLLAASKRAGVRRVVYAASSSAYGDTPTLPKVETMRPMPLSPYAVSKLTGEHYCQVYASAFGLETVSLRYFNVFGPRQPPDSPYAAVIPRFIEAMLVGQSPVIYGDGRQSRDFTFVEDVVQANLRAADAPAVAGKVFNIACGRRTSLLDLISKINALLGTDIEPIHEAPRPGDVRDSQADISRAQAELGFCPRTDVDRGIRGCLDYYSSRRSPVTV